MSGTSPKVFAVLALAVTLLISGCKGEETATGMAPSSSVTQAPPAENGNASASPNETMPGAPASASAPSTGKATVVKVDIIPVNQALPKENKTIPHFAARMTWKNDGTTPIGTLKGDIRAFDKDGKLTYEEKDALLFAKYDDESQALKPGATEEQDQNSSLKIKDLKAGDPVRAEVTITYAGPVTKLP